MSEWNKDDLNVAFIDDKARYEGQSEKHPKSWYSGGVNESRFSVIFSLIDEVGNSHRWTRSLFLSDTRYRSYVGRSTNSYESHTLNKNLYVSNVTTFENLGDKTEVNVDRTRAQQQVIPPAEGGGRPPQLSTLLVLSGTESVEDQQNRHFVDGKKRDNSSNSSHDN